MYYEERVINGRLCYRCSPSDGWTEMGAAELTARLSKAEQERDRLRTALERIEYLMAQPQDDDTDPNEYRPTATETKAMNAVLSEALRGAGGTDAQP